MGIEIIITVRRFVNRIADWHVDKFSAILSPLPEHTATTDAKTTSTSCGEF